jgi:hypothetical protein
MKRTGGVSQGVGPEFKPKCRKKQETNKQENMIRFSIAMESVCVFPHHFPEAEEMIL